MKGKNKKDQVSEPCQSSNQKDLSSTFLNIQDIAGYLKFPRSTVYSLVEAKQIPHYRVGRQIRFLKEDIDQWMIERKEEVIDIRVEVDKVFRSTERKGDLDVNRTVKKTIEDVRGRRYTSFQEKPGRIKGLGKEGDHGII